MVRRYSAELAAKKTACRALVSLEFKGSLREYGYKQIWAGGGRLIRGNVSVNTSWGF